MPITDSSTNDHRQPMLDASAPAMQQRHDLRERDGGRQEADRLGLLPAVVVAGDDHGERRCDKGDRGAIERLDGEQHPSARW